MAPLFGTDFRFRFTLSEAAKMHPEAGRNIRHQTLDKRPENRENTYDSCSFESEDIRPLGNEQLFGFGLRKQW